MINKMLLLLVTFLMSQSLFAASRIVYGVDNRVDPKKVQNEKMKALGQAVAGRVLRYSYTEVDNGDFVEFDRILTLSSPRSMNVCKDEKFADQPTVADCTGFLVGENLLVTAGHCMVRMGDTVENDMTYACESNSWMFDYKTDATGKIDLKNVSSKNIYNCKNVVYGKYDKELDFALIELDRKVEGRKPLKLNFDKKIKSGTPIFVMGHPTGLPLKFASDAKVFEVNNNYFSTNLDTFGGNSGSPVVNLETLEVEGILVRGDTDYYPVTLEDGTRCNRVNTCDANRENCKEDDPNIKGEHVTIISALKGKI